MADSSNTKSEKIAALLAFMGILSFILQGLIKYPKICNFVLFVSGFISWFLCGAYCFSYFRARNWKIKENVRMFGYFLISLVFILSQIALLVSIYLIMGALKW